MSSRAMMWWGVALMAAAVVLGAVIALGYTDPPGLDRWWGEAVGEHAPAWMVDAALVLDEVGGGWIGILAVPLAIVAALLVMRRWRGAVFAVGAFLASAAIVQLLKNIYARARPEDMAVASDFGSFPSGHTANAATIAVVLWVLVPRRWIAVIGVVWVAAMAFSRTLLSVHWITDTVAGALVGASAALLLAAWALPWARRVPGRSDDSDSDDSSRDDPSIDDSGSDAPTTRSEAPA